MAVEPAARRQAAPLGKGANNLRALFVPEILQTFAKFGALPLIANRTQRLSETTDMAGPFEF